AFGGQVDVRFAARAFEALQEAAEARLTAQFHGANLLALHAKRVTIQGKDMRLLRVLRYYMYGEDTAIPNAQGLINESTAS
ncbi:MAG: hypothetical protein M1823_006459, partial [Watsoniomyces obsoletus]